MIVFTDDTKIVDGEFVKTQLDSIKRKRKGISTGYEDIDYQWRGLFRGDTYLIGARPAMGKTAFALNIILNLALKGEIKAAYFSLDQSKEQLLNRLLTIQSEVEGRHIRTGKLEDSEWILLNEAANRIGNGNIVMNDTPEIRVEELDRELSSDKMAGVQVVFIDYLQVLNTQRKELVRMERIYHITRTLKHIAQKHNVAMVVLSQLSEKPEKRENRRPITGDFMEPEIVSCFDNVAFIYRDEYYDGETELKGIAEIITAKNKYGSRGVVNLAWHPEYQKFSSLKS